jgi:mono/diheme cytochrome c family protein
MLKPQSVWLVSAALLAIGLLGGWWLLTGDSHRSFLARSAIRIVWLKVSGELPHLGWTRIYGGMSDSLLEYFPQSSAGDDRRFTVEQTRRGGELYSTQCATCHGERGTGGVAPTLTRAVHALGTSDAGLFRIISNGIPGKMPGVALSDDEVWSLVAFVRALRSGQGLAKVEPDAQSTIQVPYERVVRAATESENWLTYSGTYDGQRFSRLDQITRDTVSSLQLSTQQPGVGKFHQTLYKLGHSPNSSFPRSFVILEFLRHSRVPSSFPLLQE